MLPHHSRTRRCVPLCCVTRVSTRASSIAHARGRQQAQAAQALGCFRGVVAATAPQSPPPLPQHAPRSRGVGAMRGRGGLLSAGSVRASPRSRVAAVALALLTAFTVWSGMLAPRRYPPVVPGERRLHLPPGLPPPPPRGTVEVVVSRYKDDLEWLPVLAALLNANVTVYCKESSAPPPRVPCAAQLPNVGNEGHSYLTHMERRHASLAPLTLFLPDTLWNDGTLAKPHFAHDIVVAIRRSRGQLAFADMHVPDSPPRALYGWIRELWQGYKLPCTSRERGGECRWDGTSGANTGAGGMLTPATPPDFWDWMRVHTGTRHRDMLWCGWSFRGVFAASAASVRKHPPRFYAHLREQLAEAVFPVAGMYMERMWRRVLLCMPADAPGSLMPWERSQAGR